MENIDGQITTVLLKLFARERMSFQLSEMTMLFTVCEELAADGCYGIHDPQNFSTESSACMDAAAKARRSAARGGMGWKGPISAFLVLDWKNRAVARFPL